MTHPLDLTITYWEQELEGDNTRYHRYNLVNEVSEVVAFYMIKNKSWAFDAFYKRSDGKLVVEQKSNFTTSQKAMVAADNFCKSKGYKLLSEEQSDKLRLLL